MNLDAHEITPGLWVGSVPPGGWAVARRGFDVLVFSAVEFQPGADRFPGVNVHHIPLIDDGSVLSELALQQALDLAEHLACAIERRQKVLVTCLQGRNRSAFIAALTFAYLHGCKGEVAVRIVRCKRQSPFGRALMNRHFVSVLEAIPSRSERMALAEGGGS